MITTEIEKQIQLGALVITNPEDRQDAIQYIKLKLLQNETIFTYKILQRFIYGRLQRWLKVNKAQGLTFTGRPTIYETDNILPQPEFVKLPYSLAGNRIITNQRKLRRLVTWIINTWLKQC